MSGFVVVIVGRCSIRYLRLCGGFCVRWELGEEFGAVFLFFFDKSLNVVIVTFFIVFCFDKFFFILRRYIGRSIGRF